MSNPKWAIAVFTAWPELINNAYNCCELKFQDSVASRLTATFGSSTVSQALARYVARVHDRRLHSEFEYCLFINQPVLLEIADLLPWIDSEHTTYMGWDQNFILYRRGRIWKAKDIDIASYPAPAGIIFIDCWQHISNSKWLNCSYDFDFYKQIKQILPRYNLRSLVFHTNLIDDFILSTELQIWHDQANAVDIMSPAGFQHHYQKTNLQNWIVVGAHWQNCMHERPLGFKSLLELKQQDSQLRIFSHMDCTVKFAPDNIEFLNPQVSTLTELDYKNDSLIWATNGKLSELLGVL